MKVFQDYALYYNAFYKEKNYKAEAKQVDILLNMYGNNIKKVINFGCGTGKHDIELSKLGYSCTGIDSSPLMIRIAKENNHPLTNYSIADIRNYISTEKYDSVISLFHVISYQNTNDDVLATFRTARKALKEGGIFLFDVWYGPGVLSDKPTVRIKEASNDQYRLLRIATPVMHNETNVVDVCYEILVIDKKSNNVSKIDEIHNMRYFFRPELEAYLKETGFELLDNLDCVTLGKTSYSSWTSYFVAKAV